MNKLFSAAPFQNIGFSAPQANGGGRLLLLDDQGVFDEAYGSGFGEQIQGHFRAESSWSVCFCSGEDLFTEAGPDLRGGNWRFEELVLTSRTLFDPAAANLVLQFQSLFPGQGVIIFYEHLSRDYGVEEGCGENGEGVDWRLVQQFPLPERPEQFFLLLQRLLRSGGAGPTRQSGRLREENKRLKARLKEHSAALRATEAKAQQWKKELENNHLEFIKLTDKYRESNEALSTLAHTIDYEKKLTANRNALEIHAKIIPILRRLRSETDDKTVLLEVDLIENCLTGLTWKLKGSAHLASLLTRSEMRVASLIAEGWSSGDIANQLHIAVSTVKTHRKNIRKKLRLNKKGDNLRNVLEMKFLHQSL